ncbi:hypothetical protein LXM25_20180 [Dyadobacter sp. LJ53]|uniref:hypothetical protein n=1 Tax=Dyadobacter chenwenxiniae TaxID=2906456 RepID=UPI001F3041C8|nr:hypothetical protein [Dyadobacter chenwenxiniae]MCF0052398.1 hypothetical protein [Dyadobacter chenwenxiniae]
MRVFQVEQNPSSEEIARSLEQGFSSKYSYSFFGLGENKTVIVRKSEFVGAQISRSGNQITVHAQSPSVLLSFLDPLIGVNLMGSLFQSPLKKLEADLVAFLRNKYA